MIEIIRLTNKEIYKTFKKNLVFAVFCAFIVIISFCALTIENDGDSLYHWQNLYQQNVENLTRWAEQLGNDNNEAIAYLHQAEVYQYHLDHNIPPIDGETASAFVLSVNRLFPLVTICIILISCYLMSDEFANKTVSRLATSGVKRWKLLTSKFLATFCFAIIFMLFFALVAVIAGWLVYGFDSFSVHYVYHNGNNVVERNVLAQMFLNMFYNMTSLLTICSLAIFIATVTQNNLLGMGICFGVVIIGQNFRTFFSRYDWTKYTLFANTDLSYFLYSAVGYKNFSLANALTVLLIYLAVCMAGTYLIFCNRDIEV